VQNKKGSKMLTTLQARAIIRKHRPRAGTWIDPIWTNKVKDTSVRNVKIYNVDNDTALILELERAGGEENVSCTSFSNYSSFAGAIIVRCLAK
jgi:hypothetical protein